MRKLDLKRLVPFLGLLLFIVFGFTLFKILRSYHVSDILLRLQAIPGRDLLLSFVFTIASYLAMTFYDVMACRNIGRPLPYKNVGFLSFISYVFSNNIGLSIFSGGAVRLRLYSSYGFSAPEILKIIVFCSLTFFMGILASCGIMFAFFEHAWPVKTVAFSIGVRAAGILSLGLIVAYLFFCIYRKISIKIKGWEFSFPSWRTGLAQIGVSLVDWICAALAMYVLLPQPFPLSFPIFYGLYILAQVAGVASNVPGGLGVFDTIMILWLAPYVPAGAVVGALIIYRAIYYIIPLVIAFVLFGWNEIRMARVKLSPLTEGFARFFVELIPTIASIMIFLGGVVLLFSSATPALADRMSALKLFIPLPFIEISHFVSSVAGAVLLVVAWGLTRRYQAAFYLSLGMLAVGVAVSLVKGFDYEEAVVLSLMILLLLPTRKYFFRRSRVSDLAFSLPWLSLILIVMTAMTWILFFSFKHVEYSHSLWWQFSFESHASRSLRALAGGVVLILVVGVTGLYGSRRPRFIKPDDVGMAKVRRIVALSPGTDANLALLGDKDVIFNLDETAFVMFGIKGSSWIAMGDPVGPPEKMTDLIWRFKEECEKNGGTPVFYEVGADNLNFYIDAGFSLFKIGEEAKVDLSSFLIEDSQWKKLRYVLRRMEEREGCSFEVVPAGRESVTGLIPELRAVSDSWLAEKKTKEKKFSLGYFDEGYLVNFPIALVRRGGKIIAFSNIWAQESSGELSIDLMRHEPAAPDGIMDFLLVRLFLWGRERKYRTFNLGMAPLAGIKDKMVAPFWNRVAVLIYSYGRNFYNFEGLRNFKNKFGPVWSSKYIVFQGAFNLPRILIDIASLTSGGLKGVFAK